MKKQLPSLSLLVPRQIREHPNVQQASAGMRLAVLAVQALFGIAAAALVIWVLLGMLLNVGRRVPGDSHGVLSSAQLPHSFSFETQTVRTLTLDGDSLRQDADRVFTVDLKQRKFQGSLVGFAASPVRLSSDSAHTARLVEDQNQSWQTVNPIPAETIAPPSPRDLLSAHPHIASSKATIRGLRAWALSFEPTPQILNTLLMSRTLGIAASDVAAINAGHFTTRWATAWVTRDDRQMLMLDVKVDLADGASYRILTQYNSFNRIDLSKLQFSRAGASG